MLWHKNFQCCAMSSSLELRHNTHAIKCSLFHSWNCYFYNFWFLSCIDQGDAQCTMLKNKYHYRMEAIWVRTIGDLGLGCFCHITHCYNVEENTSFASFHLVVWRIRMIGLCVTNVLCSKLDDVSTTAYNLVMCVQGLQLMTWGFVQYYVFIT